jgi:hypothetical protein
MDVVDDDGAGNAAIQKLITLTWTLTTTMAMKELRDGMWSR